MDYPVFNHILNVCICGWHQLALRQLQSTHTCPAIKAGGILGNKLQVVSESKILIYSVSQLYLRVSYILGTKLR